MTPVGNRLLFLIFALVLVVLIWGCAQTDDITARISVTEIYLEPNLLPTAPAGMIYQLWAARKPVTSMSIPANELMSIGRFSYISDDTISAFLNESDSLRADSNLFRLDGDILDYSTLFVTIQEDGDSTTPGPIMLLTPISTRANELSMRYPLNDMLTDDASIAFNMEGVTDGNRFANDGGGVWFTFYQASQINLPDTIGVTITFTEDTIDPVIDPGSGDTLNLSEFHDPDNIDSIIYSFDTIPYFFGRDTIVFVNEFGPGTPQDTLKHVSTTRTVYRSPDNTFPFTVRDLNTEVFDTVINFITLNVFLPSGFEMPDFSDWGWKYKGWVTSTQIPNTWLGSMTLPAWDITPSGSKLVPGANGGLLTTGTFSKTDRPDDSDPFTFMIADHVIDTGAGPETVYKRPLAPGEDFLDSVALDTLGITNTGAINLLPLPAGNTYGSIFISLEPVNRVTDTTNFPLIPFIRSFPATWPAPNSTDIWLLNYSSTDLVTAGFPLIKVKFNRL